MGPVKVYNTFGEGISALAREIAIEKLTSIFYLFSIIESIVKDASRGEVAIIIIQDI